MINTKSMQQEFEGFCLLRCIFSDLSRLFCGRLRIYNFLFCFLLNIFAHSSSYFILRQYSNRLHSKTQGLLCFFVLYLSFLKTKDNLPSTSVVTASHTNEPSFTIEMKSVNVTKHREKESIQSQKRVQIHIEVSKRMRNGGGSWTWS